MILETDIPKLMKETGCSVEDATRSLLLYEDYDKAYMMLRYHPIKNNK